MARPLSDDKRKALLSAATRVIVQQGLGAPTALIAQEAGVANGTFFVYFKTKSELFNQLYIELKSGMASAALASSPDVVEAKEQFYSIWYNWMRWAFESPEKRRALALLGLSDELSEDTREEAHRIMAPIASLILQIYKKGSLRKASFEFVNGLLNSMAETTMDFMGRTREKAWEYCRSGFDAAWKLLE